MENQYPFNGKSLWQSLSKGEKLATFIALPFCIAAIKGGGHFIGWLVPNIHFRFILGLILFFSMPYVFVRGIGVWLAALFDYYLFNRR